MNKIARLEDELKTAETTKERKRILKQIKKLKLEKSEVLK